MTDPAVETVHGTKREITVSPKSVTVAGEADVVVIGGGPGGFAAAVRAARTGASTILVEKYDMPGGVHTSGLQGAAARGVGGIHTELMQRFADEGCIYTATEATLPDWAGNPRPTTRGTSSPAVRFRGAPSIPKQPDASWCECSKKRAYERCTELRLWMQW